MEEINQRKRRINLLCLLGGLIGVMSLFLPWVTTTPVDVWARILYGSTSWNLIDLSTMFLNSNSDYFNIFFSATACFGALLVTIGIISSFVTPLGGWIQSSGIIIFFVFVLSYLGTITIFNAPFLTRSLSYGFFVGIIAVGITLFSFFKPMGIGYDKQILFFGDRLLVVNPIQRILFEKVKLHIYNKFAIIGALIGLFAIFLSWLYVSSIDSLSGIQLINTNEAGHDLQIVVSIFLIGTLISSLTPLGSLIQFSAVIFFLIMYPHVVSIGEGVILALISAIVILISIFYSPIDKKIEKQKILLRKLLNIDIKIKLRCFYCGNYVKHIRRPCENCSSLNDTGEESNAPPVGQ